MKRVLITGMSGAGKSSVIAGLVARGLRAFDTDEHGLSHLVSIPNDEPTGLDPGTDWVWREDRIARLLDLDEGDALFLGGCAPNQGQFHPRFNSIILLSAPTGVIVERLTTRTNNPYGKRPEDIARALQMKEMIEPLLRRVADHEIDTSAPLARVVDDVLRYAGILVDEARHASSR